MPIQLAPLLPVNEPSYELQTADLVWENGQPKSRDVGDIYWSGVSPRDEKRHVFRNQHDLLNRAQRADFLTLIETGFGFANNFLLTAELWEQHSLPARLHYIAIENRPVSQAVMAQYLSGWASAHAKWLVRVYPAPLRTTFTCHGPHNVSLTLVFDDVDRALQALNCQADVWYLDGFSPAKNATMWDESLWQRAWQLSKPGATLSTYTVAGAVRRGLSAQGFLLTKTAGFGNKAEMLVGKKPGPWSPGQRAARRITILGAGIAGASLQQGLDRRGLPSTLIGDKPGASHIPALNVYPQLTAGPQERSRFSLAANYFARHHANGYHDSPVVYRTSDDGKLKRAQTIADQFPDTFLSRCDERSICYHEAGWLVCNHQPDITATVSALRFVEGQWQLLNESNQVLSESEVLVLAGGHRMAPFLPLPGVNIRGQSLQVELKKTPEFSLTGDIGLTPINTTASLLGSTYGVGIDDSSPLNEDTESLLAAASANGHPQDEIQVSAVYTGIRRATRDRLPLVGPVPDWAKLAVHSNKLAKYPFAQYQTGLFALNALGSRGATHAPLCGDHLAAIIAGDTPLLPRKQQRMLELERFHLRDGRRTS